MRNLFNSAVNYLSTNNQAPAAAVYPSLREANNASAAALGVPQVASASIPAASKQEDPSMEQRVQSLTSTIKQSVAQNIILPYVLNECGFDQLAGLLGAKKEVNFAKVKEDCQTALSSAIPGSLVQSKENVVSSLSSMIEGVTDLAKKGDSLVGNATSLIFNLLSVAQACMNIYESFAKSIKPAEGIELQEIVRSR